MKVMVMVKASKASEAGAMPSQQLLTEMGKFNEELVKAGILLAAEGLHPSSKGVRVRFSGKDRTVMDGPFTETKELVAGFWIWQVKSMDEAIAWVKRCPNPMESESDVEIRPLFAPEDFGPALTPELKAQEEQICAAVQSSALDPPRLEDGRALLIAGMNKAYTFETRSQIPAQWERFAPQMGRIPGQVGTTSYGVCWNYRPGSGFDYLSGVEVSEGALLPKELSHVRIPAGRYAVFTHRGHVSTIAQTLDAIWTKWLPSSGHQAADAPCFERYGNEFDPQAGTGGFEIWVALKS
jgi:predicted transcriptional regulator YdeE